MSTRMQDMDSILHAVIQAGAEYFNLRPSHIRGTSNTSGAGWARRVCIYSAVHHYGVSVRDIEAAFLRGEQSIKKNTEVVEERMKTNSRWGEDVTAVAALAADYIPPETPMLTLEASPPARAGLTQAERIEAQRLRAKGFSVGALAKRFGKPEAVIAPLFGVEWGIEKARA